MKKETVSFIIPCYASEGSVALVMDEIRSVMGQKPEYDYEIIAVNDCSPDNEIAVLRREAEKDAKVTALDLAKNGGRHNALMCGCNFAKGDYIVFIDDDLQCPTDRIWDLLDPLIHGDADVSIAKYSEKKQSRFKNFGSKVNDRVASWLLEKPDELKFSNFSAMKKFVKDEIIKYTNPFPYLAGLMLRSTKNVVNVPMEERERTIGTGHYNFRKSFALWMNNFTGFSVKPLRFASLLGVVCAIIGFLFTAVTIVKKIVHPQIILGYSSLMSAILVIGGIIMLLLGMIGEYLGRVYISLNNSPQYVIREIIHHVGENSKTDNG